MTPWQWFACADFAAAAILAFVAGYLTSRRRWYDRGYRAGAARAGRFSRYLEPPVEPTVAGSRR